jgi:hypothetical protein
MAFVSGKFEYVSVTKEAGVPVYAQGSVLVTDDVKGTHSFRFRLGADDVNYILAGVTGADKKARLKEKVKPVVKPAYVNWRDAPVQTHEDQPLPSDLTTLD